MNLEAARFNMVEQQIRPWEVLDQRVLDLLARARRDEYVPEAYRNLAYADVSIPLPEGREMMTPRVEARLLQAVGVQPQDHVLEIGTGSGYLTSLLAAGARQVFSVEISPTLTELAARNLSAHGVNNATLEVGDGVKGWTASAPYDVIAVTGSMPVLARDFQQQLKIGGRLFVVVGREPVMEALLITRLGDQEWSTESLFETVLPPLEGAAEPADFVL